MDSLNLANNNLSVAKKEDLMIQFKLAINSEFLCWYSNKAVNAKVKLFIYASRPGRAGDVMVVMKQIVRMHV